MNFDLISLGLGAVFGAVGGYIAAYRNTHTLRETVELSKAGVIEIYNELLRAKAALATEKNLTEGLSQELATQAKLVK